MGAMDDIIRKREIEAQVGQIRKKVEAARNIKTSLSNADSSITKEITTWTTQYSNFQADTMSSVVVTDKFEGETADKISEKFPTTIETMDSTRTSVESVQTAIGEQISNLDTYIANLVAEIAALQSGYAAY